MKIENIVVGVSYLRDGTSWSYYRVPRSNPINAEASNSLIHSANPSKHKT